VRPNSRAREGHREHIGDVANSVKTSAPAMWQQFVDATPVGMLALAVL